MIPGDLGTQGGGGGGHQPGLPGGWGGGGGWGWGVRSCHKATGGKGGGEGVALGLGRTRIGEGGAYTLLTNGMDSGTGEVQIQSTVLCCVLIAGIDLLNHGGAAANGQLVLGKASWQVDGEPAICFVTNTHIPTGQQVCVDRWIWGDKQGIHLSCLPL